MNKEQLEELISILDEEVMVMDGFEEAFIGFSKRCGQPTLATYSFNKMVQVLVDDDMDEEEAIEYIEYNCLGAWMGDLTPIILFEQEDPWIYESDKKEIFNECYMCEESFIDILDLIDHLKTMHKNETGNF